MHDDGRGRRAQGVRRHRGGWTVGTLRWWWSGAQVGGREDAGRGEGVRAALVLVIAAPAWTACGRCARIVCNRRRLTICAMHAFGPDPPAAATAADDRLRVPERSRSGGPAPAFLIRRRTSPGSGSGPVFARAGRVRRDPLHGGRRPARLQAARSAGASASREPSPCDLQRDGGAPAPVGVEGEFGVQFRVGRGRVGEVGGLGAEVSRRGEGDEVVGARPRSCGRRVAVQLCGGRVSVGCRGERGVVREDMAEVRELELVQQETAGELRYQRAGRGSQ